MLYYLSFNYLVQLPRCDSWNISEEIAHSRSLLHLQERKRQYSNMCIYSNLLQSIKIT